MYCRGLFLGLVPVLGYAWMTGPLLTGSGATLPAGVVNVEPYLFVTDHRGAYDARHHRVNQPESHVVSPQVVIGIGINQWSDATLALPYVYARTQGKTGHGVGDMSVAWGVQLARQQSSGLDVRATAGITLPTGRYQHLKSGQLGVDARGAGAFQPALGLNLQKTIQAWRFRLAQTWGFSGPVRAHGLSAYSSVPTASVLARLGNSYHASLGTEYGVNAHWVIASDVVYQHTASTSIRPLGQQLRYQPSGEGWSIAPAVEYNANAHLGFIAGPWMSISGRNAGRFTSMVVAVDYNTQL